MDGNGKGPYSRWSEHLEQGEFERTATLKEQYEWFNLVFKEPSLY